MLIAFAALCVKSEPTYRTIMCAHARGQPQSPPVATTLAAYQSAAQAAVRPTSRIRPRSSSTARSGSAYVGLYISTPSGSAVSSTDRRAMPRMHSIAHNKPSAVFCPM
ncbi:MAG: hypothetical protein JWO85_3226 [Candidatus Eremiobacteraeota bacterium]|nr:hypothetical protein [Candidatus Eremiobacteraeota bacterium]